MIAGAAALAVCATAQPASAVVGATAARSAPSFNGSVYAIAYRGDTVYVGGAFTRMTIEGRTVTRNRLAAYSGRTGELLDWAAFRRRQESEGDAWSPWCREQARLIEESGLLEEAGVAR